MIHFFQHLFDSRPFMPHGHCYVYETEVFWLVVVSDLLIAAAYFSIPAALTVFIRRRKGLRFASIYWLFVAFIALCGLSHIMMVIGMWEPIYRLEALVKLLTGVVSLATAVVLWISIPRALKIPTPQELEATRDELHLESTRREREAAASRMKSQFIANLSHEIRTPITSLLGMLDLLKDPSMAAQHGDYLRIARQSGEHLLLLMNDILDMSRIEAGKFSLNERPFSAVRVLAATRDLMSIHAAAKQLELSTELVPGTPEHWVGDSTRISQILINLTYNAIKFTRSGSVTIRARATGQGGGSALIFDVIDTGEGIDPERRTAIFEAFEQASPDTAARHGGTGLGLSISSRLAEMMNGDIAVESEPGAGSRFTVTLRLTPAPTPTPRSAAAEKPTVLDGAHILVLEDDADNASTVANVIRRAGGRATIVGTGAAALEALEHQRFAVALFDIQLPDTTGDEVCRRWREQEARKGLERLPIIGYSGAPFAREFSLATHAGMTEFVPKPVRPSHLLSLLAKHAQSGTAV